MAIQKTITAVIKTRYDTAANFKAKNPILAAGEKATESDTRKSKTGDGTTEYSALPYDKADTGLTFDPTPTAGSKNPVTSGGVKTALDGKLSLTGNASSATKAESDWDGNRITDTYAKKTDVPAVTVSGNTISFGSVTIGVD